MLPRPPDWRPGLEVVGYWFPPLPHGWTPPDRLVHFLAAGAPPIFFGLGSMASRHGQRLGELAVTAMRRAKLRGIIQAGSAGLSVSDDQDDVLAIGEIPHQWLFPQMAAVVHHGGAGTTAAALRAGVPAVAVPVQADQPFWAARTVALGTSPGSVPFKQLTAGRLAAAVTAAVAHGPYRQRAAAVAGSIAHEDGCARVVAAVDTLLDRTH